VIEYESKFECITEKINGIIKKNSLYNLIFRNFKNLTMVS